MPRYKIRIVLYTEYEKVDGNFCAINRCILPMKDLTSHVLGLHLSAK